MSCRPGATRGGRRSTGSGPGPRTRPASTAPACTRTTARSTVPRPRAWSGPSSWPTDAAANGWGEDTMFTARRMLGLAMAGLLAVTVACGGGGSKASSAAPDGTVRKVPQDFATIQKAVKASKSGDLILVSPGVYHEAVNV